MQGIQALFEQCQASMDPNSIAHLLAHHPYHIDALLAMFELYRCALLPFLVVRATYCDQHFWVQEPGSASRETDPTLFATGLALHSLSVPSDEPPPGRLYR